jgi:hypothetical protein
MYAIVSVPLDCVSVNVVAVVCTRTVAMADVSFAVQTGAELYAVGNVTVAVPDARATDPAKELAAMDFSPVKSRSKSLARPPAPSLMICEIVTPSCSYWCSCSSAV